MKKFLGENGVESFLFKILTGNLTTLKIPIFPLRATQHVTKVAKKNR